MIQSKLSAFGTTIFTVMSQLAADHKAINLGQGFPDFEPDQRLRDLVSSAMNEGHNQYPPMPGFLGLRQGVSEKVERLYNRHYDAQTEITITNGASEALTAAILACAGTGDEVIVIEPSYDLYRPALTLAGATPVAVSMDPPSATDPHYRIDWNRVRDAVTPKTRAIVINSPHNPTGSTLSAEDLDALEGIVSSFNLLVISDEVYEHIVFDGATHRSVASRPALAERAFVISSFGKTYHMTGWKVGYCCAPAALTTELRKVHQYLVFTVSSPMQVALAEYMRDPEPIASLSAFYQGKRDWLAQALGNTALKPLPSAGTFFLLADYSSMSTLPELEFAKWLTVEHGVTAIPLAAFYTDSSAAASNNGLVRLCFAKRESTLAAAVDRLSQI